MSDKRENNTILTILLVAIFILVLTFTYMLTCGRHSYTPENRPLEGFTYTKKRVTGGKVEREIFSTTTAAASPSTTHTVMSVPKEGYMYDHFETVAVVLPKNKFSPIPAVRDARFTWDDTPYYNAHTAKLGPMARSSFDAFVEAKLMTKLDDIDLNQEMIPLIRRAEEHPSIKYAAALIKSGKYDDALISLRNTAQTTDNICVRSLALSYIIDIYRRTGDSAQEKKAWGALAVINTQIYMKTFPDKINALKSVSAVARDAVKRFETDRPYLNFKLPNKDF